MKAIFIAALLSLCGSAVAGEFEITGQDVTTLEVHYTGGVDHYDHLKWQEVEKLAAGRTIILTLDTPGGSAWGGAALYWAIESYDHVITVAGSEMGAWSAGAIMWMAGDHRIVAEHGAVGWHRAFCQWDPNPMPDIGCDVTVFDEEMDRIFHDAGYGYSFTYKLIVIQFHHGTDGWIIVTNDGWFYEDMNEDLRIPADPAAIGVPPRDWSVI